LKIKQFLTNVWHIDLIARLKFGLLLPRPNGPSDGSVSLLPRRDTGPELLLPARGHFLFAFRISTIFCHEVGLGQTTKDMLALGCSALHKMAFRVTMC